MKVNVAPSVLLWARERAALSVKELADRTGVVPETVMRWEHDGIASLIQLRKISHITHTPFGALFLSAPPQERLPIADLRTLPSDTPLQPSTELLDTIRQCQRRQIWYREYLVRANEQPLDFVGSASIQNDAVEVADDIRSTLGIADGLRNEIGASEDPMRVLADKAESAGILVMRNGVVGNNTYRLLSIDEFRGFCLSDSYAPLVFINAADSKAAQLFTLAHELAHIWIGASGVTDLGLRGTKAVERFCNSVAANVIVPLDAFLLNWISGADPLNEARRLARMFRVSTLAMIIRAREAGRISEDIFRETFDAEVRRLESIEKGGGGNFYSNQNSRIGKPFARAVIASAIDGDTSYTEAFSLLDVSSTKTFSKLAEHMGVAA